MTIISKVRVMGKKKRIKDVNWGKVVIDLSNVQFTLKDKKAPKEVPQLSKLIITRARQGDTLSMILYDCEIPESKWVPYVNKHGDLKTAVQDAAAYHKAYGERLLYLMARGKRKHSPQMAKLLMSNFYDIREVPVNETDDFDFTEILKAVADLLPN